MPLISNNTEPALAKRCEIVKPQQTVLVFQGGGALGAYQAGVFEALHEKGVVPDWIIGTSIGAINGAIIAANKPEDRLSRLREFWRRVEARRLPAIPFWGEMNSLLTNWTTVTQGLPGFFTPNPLAWLGGNSALSGLEQAAFYKTDALRETLHDLTSFDYLLNSGTRLSLGAVNVHSGEMRYFDSKTDESILNVEHVMASGALPPAFPAITIEGESYWDGGIVSNTPIEVIFDDSERKDSLVFAVNLWQSAGVDPKNVWDASARHKDIQYSSRAATHIEDERKIMHLRKVIEQLAGHLPAAAKKTDEVRDLLDCGGFATLHIVRLFAPVLDGENYTKDMDFSHQGIVSRWQAGYDDTLTMLAAAPWDKPCDILEGIHVHTLGSIDENAGEGVGPE